MTPAYVAELHTNLDKAQALSSAFYARATEIGVHPLIEFCGFMNEWIKLCREALAVGIDYSQISVHGSAKEGLPIRGHRLYRRKVRLHFRAVAQHAGTGPSIPGWSWTETVRNG